MYEARKKTQGTNNQYVQAKSESLQNANFHDERTPRTSDIIGQELGVNPSTVIRAEKFSKGVDAIRDVSPAAAEKILQGGTGVKKSEVQTFTQMPENEQKQEEPISFNSLIFSFLPLSYLLFLFSLFL